MYSIKSFAGTCLVAIIFATASISAFRVSLSRKLTINQFPHLVQLRHSSEKLLICAGTLVTPEYVLTTATCALRINVEEAVVVGGASTIEDNGLQRAIVNLTLHPDFDSQIGESNIAIIKLSEPLSDKNIGVVALCRRDIRPDSVLEVSGWNQNVDDYIRNTKVPVTTPEMCANRFDAFVKRNMFCGTGWESKANCFGGEGDSALLYGELCGIVALGGACGEQNRLTAFTDINAVRPFIDSIIEA